MRNNREEYWLPAYMYRAIMRDLGACNLWTVSDLLRSLYSTDCEEYETM